MIVTVSISNLLSRCTKAKSLQIWFFEPLKLSSAFLFKKWRFEFELMFLTTSHGCFLQKNANLVRELWCLHLEPTPIVPPKIGVTTLTCFPFFLKEYTQQYLSFPIFSVIHFFPFRFDIRLTLSTLNIIFSIMFCEYFNIHFNERT